MDPERGETGLTRRGGAGPALKSIVTGVAHGEPKAIAVSVAGVAVTGVGGTFVVEEIASHAGSFLAPVAATAWNDAGMGLITLGSSAVLAAGVSTFLRRDRLDGERQYSNPVDKATHVGIPTRNFMRAIAGGALVAAGSAAAIAAGLDHMAIIPGLHSAPGAATVLAGIAQITGGVGIASGVTAVGWHRRAQRQLGTGARRAPAALAE